MQAVFSKDSFYRKLILEATSHRPPEIESLKRFMFPKTKEDVDFIKNFFQSFRNFLRSLSKVPSRCENESLYVELK